MRESALAKVYFLGSAVCLLISAGLVLADTCKFGEVGGADNCEQTCYDDQMVYYECTHEDANSNTCEEGMEPTEQITDPTGCIKNIKYYSFCEGASSGSGADCPMEEKEAAYLKQWANEDTPCNSALNSGGTWNVHNPGECESFPTYCTSFETSGCSDPTVEGQLRCGTVNKCES